MARHPERDLLRILKQSSQGVRRRTPHHVPGGNVFPFHWSFSAQTRHDLATEEGIFLIKAAQLPGANVGVIDVPFRGRKLKVSGDRSLRRLEHHNVTNDVIL